MSDQSPSPNPLPPTSPDPKEVKRLRQAYGLDKSDDAGVAQYSAAGVELAMIVIVMGAIGWGLDKLLHSAPWIMLVGLLIGIVGGMTRLVLRFGRVK